MSEMERTINSLAEASAVLQEQNDGLGRSFANLSENSKLWTIGSRLLSGSGLWRIQNKIRAVGNVLTVFYDVQDSGTKKMLENAKNMKKITESVDYLTDSLKNLDDTPEFDSVASALIAATGKTKDELEVFEKERITEQAEKLVEGAFQSQLVTAKKVQRRMGKELEKAAQDSPFITGLQKFADGFWKSGAGVVGSVAKMAEKVDLGDLPKKIDEQKDNISKANKKIKELKDEIKYEQKIFGEEADEKKLERWQEALKNTLEEKKLAQQDLKDLRAETKEIKDKGLKSVLGAGKAAGEAQESEGKVLKWFKDREEKLKEHRLKGEKWQARMMRLQNAIGRLATSVMKYSFLFVAALIGVYAIYKFFQRNGPSLLITFGQLRDGLLWGFGILSGVFESLYEDFIDLKDAFVNGDIMEVISLGLSIVKNVIFAGLISLGLILGALLGAVLALLHGAWIQAVEDTANWVEAAIQWTAQIAALIMGILLIIGLIASFQWITMLGLAVGTAIASAIGFASTGGTVTTPLTVVGERGPEIVSLPKGSQVTSNAQSKNMRGGVTNNITVQVQGRIGASDQEIRDIAKKVGEHINREINRHTSSGVRRYG